MQWFRLYQEFASDPKVQMMPENYQRRLIMAFCIRCNSDVTLHDDEMAFQLRISSEEWAATKAEFIKRGFMNKDGSIANWDKRQYVSDSSNQRVKKHREKKKQECNVTVTPPDTDTDTEQKVVSKETRPRSRAKPETHKPEDVSEVVWKDFTDLRKKKRAPVTETALNSIRDEAAIAGWSLQSALAECCARGWQGFKAEWVLNKGQGPPKKSFMGELMEATVTGVMNAERGRE